MRFLVDANLPPALAKHLVTLGHDAHHVFRLGLKGSQDQGIWAHAKATTSVIVSRDDDFVVRRILEGGGPSVVWVRLGNVRRATLLPKFEAALPQIVQALSHGDAVVELG